MQMNKATLHMANTGMSGKLQCLHIGTLAFWLAVSIGQSMLSRQRDLDKVVPCLAILAWDCPRPWPGSDKPTCMMDTGSCQDDVSTRKTCIFGVFIEKVRPTCLGPVGNTDEKS